jgi:hemerythrin superfamily protein
MQPSKKEAEKDTVPTYGLLVINHAYNEGKITFQEWLELSREWAKAVICQYEKDEEQKAS